jgi:hypothetical protein
MPTSTCAPIPQTAAAGAGQGNATLAIVEAVTAAGRGALQPPDNPVAPAPNGVPQPKYLPCVQGPPALRFWDTLSPGNYSGNDAALLGQQLPPSIGQRLAKKVEEKELELLLEAVPTLDEEGQLHVSTPAGILWLPSLLTDAAEAYIADCSREVAVLAAAVNAAPDRDLRQLAEMLLAFYKSNLDFMKWWLQNRRQKDLAR